MARALRFSIGGEIFTAEPSKLDRKKLYGWREKVALDDDGAACSLISMSECGTICIPGNGGTGLGLLTPDGNWVNREQVKMVNLDGSPAVKAKSSFDVIITLEGKASPEDLLNCAVKGFYRLGAELGMIEAIGSDIYQFEYCFRDSYVTSPAFLLAAELNGNKELFMFTGPQHDFPFIDFDEIGIPDDSDGDFDEDESENELDFAMF